MIIMQQQKQQINKQHEHQAGEKREEKQNELIEL